MNGERGATKVSLEEDDATAVFAHGADQGQSADYLMLQHPLQTEGQDKRLGLTVCTSNEITKRSGATDVSGQYEASKIASESI